VNAAAAAVVVAMNCRRVVGGFGYMFQPLRVVEYQW